MSAHRYPPTTLNPYLELPHVISLSWLAYPIISLAFIVLRIKQSEASSQEAVAGAKQNLLASCSAAERAATGAASLPRYMAAATNKQIQDAVNGSLEAARQVMILSLTVMAAVINFVIDLYRSTLLCFAEFAVRGALSVLITATEEFNNFFRNNAGTATAAITTEIENINNRLRGITDSLPPFVDVDIPQLPVPDLSALANIQLPSTFQDQLTQLNSSLPSVADLKDKLEAILNQPFELLKKEINDSFIGLSFDANAVALPQQNSVTFCGDLDTSIIDDLGRDLKRGAFIGVLIVVGCAALLFAASCAIHWYRFRSLKRHIARAREIWNEDPNPSDRNLLKMRARFASPFLMRLADWIAQRLRLSPANHIHLQWFLTYIFHGPALGCLIIGVFGFISVQIQIFSVGPLSEAYANRSGEAVASFSNTIATSVNNSMYQQSSAYASDLNTRVDTMQKTVNDDLFGWVNVTTSAINDTVSTFYQEVQQIVDAAFGGSILDAPARTFVQCFIGSKVEAIQEGIAFLQENLQVQMPRVNENVLVLSPEAVDEVSGAVATAANGGGNENSTPLVERIVQQYIQALKEEQLFFAVFAGLWVLVVIMGICVVLWHSCVRSPWEMRRRRRLGLGPTDGVQMTVATFNDAHSDIRDEKGRDHTPEVYPFDNSKPGYQFDLTNKTAWLSDLVSAPAKWMKDKKHARNDSPAQQKESRSPRPELRLLAPNSSKKVLRMSTWSVSPQETSWFNRFKERVPALPPLPRKAVADVNKPLPPPLTPTPPPSVPQPHRVLAPVFDKDTPRGPKIFQTNPFASPFDDEHAVDANSLAAR